VEPILEEFWGYWVKADVVWDGLVGWVADWSVVYVVSYGALWGVLVGLVVRLFVHHFGFGIYLVVPSSDLGSI